MNNVLETVFIEVDKDLLGMNNNALIGVICRPPDTDIELFNEMLNDIMSVIASENKSYYLLGDYNINLLNIESHSTTREFVDTMYTYSSFPNITKPTRAISSTLIDNIFSNDILTQYETISGLFDTDITDHFPIFHIVFSSQVTESKNTKPYRVINEKNMAKFQSRLATHEWNHILSSNDTQRAFTSFHDTIMQIYNECFPFSRSHSVYKSRKPWLSDALRKSIKEKNRLYRYSRNFPDSLAVKKYKEYKNRLTVLLRIAEKDHYAQLMEENKSNLQNSWRILKEVINKKKSTSTCSKFLVNGKYITDKNAIADGFNSFFVNIGPNLASKIPESTTPCTKFIRGDRLSQSIFLSATNEEEITMCTKLLNNGSPGWDNISSKIIKTSCPLIIQPLTHISWWA